jgi:GNAT superfamily N-acetyltransferase
MPIRLAEPKNIPAITRVSTQVWRSSYYDLLPDSFLNAIEPLGAEKIFRESFSSEGSSYFVLLAEDAKGEALGYLDGGRDRIDSKENLGEVYGMYLYEAHQGKGWGKELLQEAFRRFRALGFGQARAWVLREGKARGFYEKAGGRLESLTKRLTLGEDSITLVSYKWNL